MIWTLFSSPLVYQQFVLIPDGPAQTHSILPTLFLSAFEISVPFLSLRLRDLLFLVKMCALYALLRLTFPLAVFLNRFAAPRFVFIFGIGYFLSEGDRKKDTPPFYAATLTCFPEN